MNLSPFSRSWESEALRGAEPKFSQLVGSWDSSPWLGGGVGASSGLCERWKQGTVFCGMLALSRPLPTGSPHCPCTCGRGWLAEGVGRDHGPLQGEGEVDSGLQGSLSGETEDLGVWVGLLDWMKQNAVVTKLDPTLLGARETWV